jgi:2-keto-myo-inositol isomerase
MNRRTAIASLGLGTAFSLGPNLSFARSKQSPSKFKYCLNTSTISGQKAGFKAYMEVAAKAGYDGVEVWVQDVKEYKTQGNSLKTMKKFLDDSGVVVEDAIGFAPWMVDDDEKRKAGFEQMREEMNMMAELGCKRIAAPSAGVKADKQLDLRVVGERYKQLLDLGRQTGVMPQLEFWGASPVFSTMGQALMAASFANDPDVRILPDVYHLFRGNSGFECLKMVSGNLIDVIHFNDYPSSVPREQQKDSDRVYPGDGVAPLKQVINDLINMGGTKVLSLEVFNQEYWKADPLVNAKTGLEKMKKAVAMASASK